MVHYNKKEVPTTGSVPEVLIKELTEVVVTHPLTKGFGGTGADNAFYGGVRKTKDGLLLDSYQYPCHRYIEYIKDPEGIYSRYAHRPTLSEDATRNYFDWITSDEGPWKEFKGRTISHVPENVPNDKKMDWVYENGWVWTDLSTPSNLQHSFLVASRMAAEWPKLISKWNVWQKKFSRSKNKVRLQSLCFVFQDVFRHQTGEKHWQINYGNLYDWPLDVCSAGEGYVKNFLSGKIESLNQPYGKNQIYRPVNRIFGDNSWDQSTSHKDKVYPAILYDLYNSDTGTMARLGLTAEESKEKFKNQFGLAGFNPKKFWAVEEKEILDIIEMENERLG